MSMHSGARSNVRASNMAKMVNNGSTFSDFKLGDMHSLTHPKAVSGGLYGYNTTVGGVVTRSNITSGRRQSGYLGQTGEYNAAAFQTADPVPVLFVSTQSRYSVATNNAQSLQSFALPGPATATSGRPSSYSNIKFGELVGLSYNAITTDTVGNLQGADGTRDGLGQTLTSNTGTTRSNNCNGGYADTGAESITRFYRQAGGKNLGVTAADFGWTVTTTFHNNQWEEIYLNTIAGPGDMVVVVAQSGGGTMYTFTGDPIYLRTASGGSVSGTTVITEYSPTKNSTSTDTWVAVYSATVGSGQYVGKVGVNPYHSGTQYYIFHTFVIRKGALTNPSITVFRRDKYGNSGTSQPKTSSIYPYPNYGHGNNAQGTYITLATTPFAFGNTDYGGDVLGPTSTDNYDLAFEGYGSSNSILPGTSNANYMGRWNVTMCNYTGFSESTSNIKSGTTVRFFDGIDANRYYPGVNNSNYVSGPQPGQFKPLAYAYDVLTMLISR